MVASEVYVVDSRIASYEAIVAALPEGVQVYILPADQDGISAITALVAGRTDLQAIHILGHGEAGAIQLDTRNNRDFGGAMIRLVLDEVSGAV